MNNVANFSVSSLMTGLYIDGKWRSASDGRIFRVENPASGERLADIADASVQDGADALTAAHKAQPSWSATPPRERADLLHELFAKVIKRTDELAEIMTLEMGKPLAEARGEVRYAADFLRWYAEETVRPRGDYRQAPAGDRQILVTSRPVGPSLLITPWNFPLAMATRKLAPALGAGCTAILKPSELTPLTSSLLMELVHEAGMPAGVVNFLPTSEPASVVTPLLEDGRLRKLSFTGSTQVGKLLLAASAKNVLRTSMELGGNAPFLVFADADLDRAVAGAMSAKYRNMGEACTAANRFIVHESVASSFVGRITQLSIALRVGNGADPGVQIGPLVDGRARRKVDELVQDALAYGAELHTGGEFPGGKGYFYPPTVLSGAGPEARMHHEEIFGPVVSVRTFKTEEEAITMANDTEYGLASYVFTTDLARGFRLAAQLQAGMVGLNSGTISDAAAPFGGVKQSGLGREGSHHGIEEYLETVYIGIAV